MMWRLKLWIKIFSGWFPILKTGLKRFGFFRHGHMESLAYAVSVFNRHWNKASGLNESSDPPKRIGGVGDAAAESGGIPSIVGSGRGTCLEIGPGESLMTMLVARAAGFEGTVLVDYGWQAEARMQQYLDALERLRSIGYALTESSPSEGLEGLLKTFNAHYLTQGLDSMKEITSDSVEFSFSQAVFEHIPKAQLAGYLRELKRVGKKGGFSSHRVDLKDHLGGSINQLRFSEAFWESPNIYRSGIYTNRLRFSQWLRLFEQEDIAYTITQQDKFARLPMPRNLLAPEFRELEDDDLKVSGFDVILKW